MTFHLEVLGEPQRAALRLIGPRADQPGFRLAGGTALALRLGHRISVDLDFFREADFEPMELAGRLGAAGLPLAVDAVAPGTLHGTLAGARVSLLRFSYPWLAEPTPWPAMGCRVTALDDLAAMKLSALVQRGARKDFHDVGALFAAGFSVAALLEFYQRKFHVQDVGPVLTALCYFDDAEGDPEPIVLGGPGWSELKDDFRGRVKAFTG